MTSRGKPREPEVGPVHRPRRRCSVPKVGPGVAARPETIEAHSDEWVSDRNSGREGRSARAPGLVFDLAAERSLMEVAALGVLIPMTLGWFWLLNAMSGRTRL